jgi:hypothetical protein
VELSLENERRLAGPAAPFFAFREEGFDASVPVHIADSIHGRRQLCIRDQRSCRITVAEGFPERAHGIEIRGALKNVVQGHDHTAVAQIRFRQHLDRLIDGGYSRRHAPNRCGDEVRPPESLEQLFPRTCVQNDDLPWTKHTTSLR